MLERAREVTCHEGWTAIEHVLFADGIVVLADSHPRHARLFDVVQKRLREECDKLQVELNEEKSRVVDACSSPLQLPNREVLRRLLEPKQYASHDYREALDQAEITCSMSRRGNCWDNAVAESFFCRYVWREAA